MVKNKYEKERLKMVEKTWGGKRQNAGRPATGAKPNRTFRLDENEYQQVKNFISNIRTAEELKTQFLKDAKNMINDMEDSDYNPVQDEYTVKIINTTKQLIEKANAEDYKWFLYDGQDFAMALNEALMQNDI